MPAALQRPAEIRQTQAALPVETDFGINYKFMHNHICTHTAAVESADAASSFGLKVVLVPAFLE
jgi:hypothetical protein